MPIIILIKGYYKLINPGMPDYSRINKRINDTVRSLSEADLDLSGAHHLLHVHKSSPHLIVQIH